QRHPGRSPHLAPAHAFTHTARTAQTCSRAQIPSLPGTALAILMRENMAYEVFELERWMTTWELDVDCDIAESGILPLSLDDVYHLIPSHAGVQLERDLHAMTLGYSEARGSLDLRTALAETYQRATPDDVLVTTGAIE